MQPADLTASPTIQPALWLHLDNVGVEYGTRQVLAGISLTLQHGEVLVISGANGSGKSSLLRVLCGLQRPSHGQVALHVGSRSFAPSQCAYLIGWVAPDLNLYRELTALENLAFFAEVRGLRRTRAELLALLQTVELAERGDDMLATFSSGMQQRMRYAYALLHHPLLLLLDEPTVTLDERGMALVERIVAYQRRHGLTVIATNDQRELRFGDYVLRLEGGDT